MTKQNKKQNNIIAIAMITLLIILPCITVRADEPEQPEHEHKIMSEEQNEEEQEPEEPEEIQDEPQYEENEHRSFSETSFEDYTVVEGLLLLSFVSAYIMLIIKMLKGIYYIV